MPQHDTPVKTETPDASIAQDFDIFMAQMESDTAFFPKKRKLSQIPDFDRALNSEETLAEADEKSDPISGTTDHFCVPSSSTSPHTSPFESIERSETSVSTQENGDDEKKLPVLETAQWVSPSVETVAVLKKSMASSSRLIGTFTALKCTYLKLCKEFNYLLGKFNENERVKIELIHENNELRKLLYETIKEKELDRKQYKAELLAREKGEIA